MFYSTVNVAVVSLITIRHLTQSKLQSFSATELQVLQEITLLCAQIFQYIHVNDDTILIFRQFLIQIIENQSPDLLLNLAPLCVLVLLDGGMNANEELSTLESIMKCISCLCSHHLTDCSVQISLILVNHVINNLVRDQFLRPVFFCVTNGVDTLKEILVELLLLKKSEDMTEFLLDVFIDWICHSDDIAIIQFLWDSAISNEIPVNESRIVDGLVQHFCKNPSRSLLSFLSHYSLSDYALQMLKVVVRRV